MLSFLTLVHFPMRKGNLPYLLGNVLFVALLSLRDGFAEGRIGKQKLKEVLS